MIGDQFNHPSNESVVSSGFDFGNLRISRCSGAGQNSLQNIYLERLLY